MQSPGAHAPAVSVVMIFLDGMPFIEEAVRSLREQDFRDWELLLVDDGSGDASSALARGWAAEDPARFRYLEHPGHANRGTSASRNLALAAARGEFILRLDCDDAFEDSSSLGQQVALLRAHPDAGMVCGPCRYWRAWDGGQDTLQPWSPPPGLAPASALLAPMLAPGDAEPISMLVRTSLVRACGGWDAALRDFGEDFLLTAKLLHAAPVLVSATCWYRYRMHAASYSHRLRAAGEQRHRERELHAVVARWMRECGIRDRRALAAFRRRRRASREPWLGARLAAFGDALRAGAWRAWLALRPRARGAWLRVEPESPRIAHADVVLRARLSWSVPEAGSVQLRVGSAGGPVFATGGPRGEAWTRDWASRGMWFFLQDAGAADPGSAAATLAVARLQVAVGPDQPIADSTASAIRSMSDSP